MVRTPSSPAHPVDPTRRRLVSDAVNRWINDLTDLTAKNNLLYCQDPRRVTLDLTSADNDLRQDLLDGRTIRCSRVFPDTDQRAEAVARLGKVYRNIRKLDEEYGLNTGYLAIGLASWREDRKSPASPVLLRALSVKATSAARTDFEITLEEEFAVNPVLLRKLHSDFHISISAEDLNSLVGESPFDPTPAYEQLRKLATAVPDFVVNPRLIAGTFSYAKLPMVEDLRAADNLLARNRIVAALAGDPQAIPASSEPVLTDSGSVRPEHEFLVRDADKSQTAAINAIRRGRDLVIQGPPGTGKSQTIANAIAALTAEGKRVLFVAEKRAAIDAVVKYLQQAELGPLVLDIHDGIRTKRIIAEALKTALDAVGQAAEPDLTELHRTLANRCRQVDEHAAAMNEIREPWRVSFFDAQAEFETAPKPRSAVRIRGRALTGLSGQAKDQARDELREAVRLRKLIHPPWAGAKISSREAARNATDTVHGLSTGALDTALDKLSETCAKLGIRQPDNCQSWAGLYRFLDQVAETCDLLGNEVFTLDLSSLVTATASRAERRDRSGPQPSWFSRWALRRQARNRWRAAGIGQRELHEALAHAEERARTWAKASNRSTPFTPPDWTFIKASFDEVHSSVEHLGGLLPDTPLMRVRLDHLRVAVDQLAADTQGPLQVAQLAELTSNLTKSGLREIIAETIQHDADPEQAVKALDSAWYASIVDYIRWTDRRCDVTGGPGLTAAVADFQHYDATHLARNAERIRRYAARRARDAQDTYPDQASLVKKEAGKARRHMPLRDLLSRAPDVMLALKPCWATSPIVVSQVLPLRQLFDVVIFDEASQVRQADAIPSIIRARQVVVTGDTKQLTPTDFFSSVAGDDDEYSTESSAEAGASSLARTGSEFPSILDSLATLLPEAHLTWHYRSRDERLIAFSNRHFYRSSLTTFPGVGMDVCLTHVIAESGQLVAGQEQSSAAEVERAVELIIEHAETRPEETLGVITLGSPHMNRIEVKLQSVLRDRPDLSAFFDPDGEEPFFIKNLERVQGDERDAIILSVGYGKKANNGIDYRWGPMTRPGSERRLNVAVTRAKTRLTLVTSFRTEELDATRFQNEGGKLLCAYLAYVDSDGRDSGSLRDRVLNLNPFEQDVFERLGSAGIPVIPQYGVGEMRIDFAARHPDLPGRMVLAIEADGASYHSSGTARDRDRLRQEHLERLGWRFHRIWSTDWFADPDAEITKVRAAYEQAVAESKTGGQAREADTPLRGPKAGQAPRITDRRPPRPRIQQGLAIDGYSATELTALARWIESDGRLRTQEAVAEEMRSALGVSRQGPKINQRLWAAIAVARDAVLGEEGAR